MPLTLELPGDLSREIRTILRVNEGRRKTDDGRCRACLYWAKQPGTPHGSCRRTAPVAEPGLSTSAWPRSNEDDWCGEWLPRLSAAEREELEGCFALVPGSPSQEGDPATCPHGFADDGSCFECSDHREAPDAG